MARRRRSAELGFTDLLFNALLGFVAMFVIAFLLINPIAKTGAVDHKAEFLITLTWPDGGKEDVDLYVDDPEGRLVWFRAREAGLMHLDRDDLGRSNDVIEVGGKTVVNPVNQEIVSIRGVAAGEYVVNVHLYRDDRGQPAPVKVKVEKLNPKVELVFYGEVVLRERGEERTAVRFSVGPDGRVRNAGVGSLLGLPPPIDMSGGASAAVGLTGLYAALALLLLALNLKSAWRWPVKAASIALSLPALIGAFVAIEALTGWPSPAALPERFQLHAGLVEEPTADGALSGAIYLWATPWRDDVNGPQRPRAFGLPYSRALHEQVDAMRERLAKGGLVLGRREGGDAWRRRFGRPDGGVALETPPLPPSPPKG